MKLDFREMSFIKKVYWRIRLWHMDHRFSIWVPRYYILEPSYYYTHTEEECERERQRRVDELNKIINDFATGMIPKKRAY